MNQRSNKFCAGAALALFVAGGVTPVLAVGANPGGPDWPCPQRRVDKLGAADLQWEGPPVEGVKGWSQDAAVNTMITMLANRRVPIEDAIKALKTFNDGLPAAERTQKMTLVFAGLLDTVNQYRSSVITGIERYDKRQKGRASEIEQEGLKLNEMQKKAENGGDAAAKAEYT
ncbi:MAG: hypothetical protein ACRETL_07840, partial [Gammaproteobacteria bacterium]